MNIKVFLIALFSIITLNGFSQFEIKVFGGINASTLTKPVEGFSYSPNIGYQFGASVLIGKTWYVEPGIMWMKTDQEIKVDSSSQVDNNIISTVKIPVYIGYRFFGGSENILNLRVFAGVTANIVTDIKYAGSSFNKDVFNGAIWGADIGAGLDVLFLFLDVGYEFGLSNVFTNESVNSKNNVFYVNLGFRIKI